MAKMRSRWVSHKDTPLFGINLSGYGTDRQGIVTELAASSKVIDHQPRRSVLAVLDIALTNMTPELAAFIQAHPGEGDDPIWKLAIIGVSGFQKFWYSFRNKITWPKNARFFDEHEKAKAWLISEKS